MEPELLESLDISLWSAWEDVVASVELTDADIHGSFILFIEEDYFRIVQATCSAAAASVSESRASARRQFRPMVDPGIGVTSDEAEKRARPFF